MVDQHHINRDKHYLGQTLASIPGHVFKPIATQDKARVEPARQDAEPAIPTKPRQRDMLFSQFTFIDDPALSLLIKEDISKESINSDSPVSLIKGVDDNIAKFLAAHQPPVTTVHLPPTSTTTTLTPCMY